MKNILLALLTFGATVTILGQDILGQWNGALEVQGLQLRIVFHIMETDTGLIAIMDSTDQGAKEIPVTTLIFENPNLTMEIRAAGIIYSGQLIDKSIKGVFKQGGQEFPLNLSRAKIPKKLIKRPQEPTKPYPYASEEVTFRNVKAKYYTHGNADLT